MNRLLYLLPALVLACAAPLRAPAPSQPELLATDATWSGTVQLAHTLTVPPGRTLTLAPGTRVEAAPGAQFLVQGALLCRGTVERPVVLVGDGETPGALIAASGTEAALELAHTEVRGAGTGVSAHGARVTVAGGRFASCGQGLVLEIRAVAELTATRFQDNTTGLSVGNSSRCEAANLVFADNQLALGTSNSSVLRLRQTTFTANRVGYAQKNACDAVLEHCTFADNDTAVGLSQTRRSPTLSFATFRDNHSAVVARLFSHPLIEASTFTHNDTGFDALNFCGAFLRYNEFTGNDQAIRLDKKSNTRIVGNLISGSRVALFADYSTYPEVRGNRFADNQWHVRLGIYQSADWERRQGSRRLMMEEARGTNSRNPLMLSGEVPTGPHRFTVAGNAWDAATEAELQTGEDTNVSRFWDGLDQEPVRYPGFGDGAYAVDRIHFSPPLPPGAVPVGPEAWHPLEEPRPESSPVEIKRSRRPAPPAPGAAPPGRP